MAKYTDSYYYKWPYYASIGDYESIFRSNAFKSYNAFQDDPFFNSDMYKILFHRYPKSKFICLKRDPDEWFNSMYKHSKGKTLGNTYRHCIRYRRMAEFFQRIETDSTFDPDINKADRLLSLEGQKDKYIDIYSTYYDEVEFFFKKFGKDRIYLGRLEDPDKWLKIGNFLNINVESSYNVHSNKTK